MTGDLTIHGVTKPVVLKVEGPTPEGKDPWGNIRMGASGTTKIKRSDFGLTWNAALETGGILVGDDLKIELEIQISVRRQPRPKRYKNRKKLCHYVPLKQIIQTQPTIEGARSEVATRVWISQNKGFRSFSYLLDDFRNDNPNDYLAGFPLASAPWHRDDHLRARRLS